MSTTPVFHINNRLISQSSPTYIIAEVSCNHNQNIHTALEIIREASEAGVDAIKLQHYTPDTLTLDCPEQPYFRIQGTIWEGQTLYDLYKKAYTPWEWTTRLQKEAHKYGMDFFSSPFDQTAVDLLESHHVPCYKVASFEMTDHILLKAIAKTGKPVIMSTGMATLGEIEKSLTVLKTHGAGEIALLRCTSAYPARPEDANLLTLKHLQDTFNVVVGLSDHTLGSDVAIASVALGARIVEKHITLSRTSGSPDDQFSMTPKEFKEMIQSIRIVEKSLGQIRYGDIEEESSSRMLRRSLFVVEDIKEGEKFTEKNVRSIRPAHGLPTEHYDTILGKTAREFIPRGTPLAWNLIV